MVKISYFNRVDQGAKVGHFVATLDSGMCIRCSLIKGKNGHFVSLPQRSVMINENRKYIREVYFENNDQDSNFKEALLEQLREQEGIEIERNEQPAPERRRGSWDL